MVDLLGNTTGFFEFRESVRVLKVDYWFFSCVCLVVWRDGCWVCVRWGLCRCGVRRLGRKGFLSIHVYTLGALFSFVFSPIRFVGARV